MGSIVKPLSLILPLAFSLCFSMLSSQSADPTPAPWPHQFHSILFMNNDGSLQVVDLWYDWTNGRNFNIIQNQLGKLLYDLEWDNGTSYIYTLDSNQECRVLLFPVGVLRPNWLEGATYLGQKEVDGFLCNVWQKVDFIWYYEDVITKRPVHWVFYTGMTAHVMTFEVGAVLEDPKWQAPVYCFKESEKKENAVFKSVDIAENLTAMHLKRCDRGKHCLHEGSTPPGWFPNSQSGATCCTLELAILENNETRTWDRGSDDDGNQVWEVKEGPCEFKPAPVSSVSDLLSPLTSPPPQSMGKRKDCSFILRE